MCRNTNTYQLIQHIRLFRYATPIKRHYANIAHLECLWTYANKHWFKRILFDCYMMMAVLLLYLNSHNANSTSLIVIILQSIFLPYVLLYVLLCLNQAEGGGNDGATFACVNFKECFVHILILSTMLPLHLSLPQMRHISI
jgi:hypothetical protein